MSPFFNKPSGAAFTGGTVANAVDVQAALDCRDTLDVNTAAGADAFRIKAVTGGGAHLGNPAFEQYATVTNALFTLRSTSYFGFSTNTNSGGAADLKLWRDAAHSLAQRDGTNAQSHAWYKTRADASNYERARLYADANGFHLVSEAAGTGTQRRIRLPFDILHEDRADQTGADGSYGDLTSLALAAGELAADGQAIRISGAFAILSTNVSAGSDWRCQLGGTDIVARSTISATAEQATFDILIVRTGATSVRCIGHLATEDTASGVAIIDPVYKEITGITLSASQTLRTQGQGDGAAADVTQQLCRIQKQTII